MNASERSLFRFCKIGNLEKVKYTVTKALSDLKSWNYHLMLTFWNFQELSWSRRCQSQLKRQMGLDTFILRVPLWSHRTCSVSPSKRYWISHKTKFNLTLMWMLCWKRSSLRGQHIRRWTLSVRSLDGSNTQHPAQFQSQHGQTRSVWLFSRKAVWAWRLLRCYVWYQGLSVQGP